MKRTWLLFSQTVTLLLAAYFVVATLKPQWLSKGSALQGLTVIEAPAALIPPHAVGGVGSFATAAKQASAAVVSINTRKAAVKNPQADDPWFKFFFGDQGAREPQGGLGSGVIVSASGYILTNNHVVEGADDIEVILNDTRKAKATVIGTDPDTDLAVLKIDLDKLPVIVLGSADVLQVGDPVLAIGNPFGVGQTVMAALSARWGATSWASTRLRTSSRPMRPSTLATQAGHWSMRMAIWSASTPPFTRARAAPWALVLPFPWSPPSRCWRASSKMAR